MCESEKKAVDIEEFVELSKQKFANNHWKQALCIEYFIDKITMYEPEEVKKINFDIGEFRCNGTIFSSRGNTYLWWKLTDENSTNECQGLEAMDVNDNSLRLLFCSDPTQTAPYMIPLILENDL